MTLAERVGMPLNEFIDAQSQQEFELIHGQRRIIMPPIAGHGQVIEILFLAIHAFLLIRPLGKIIRENAFVLTDSYQRDWVKGSRVPDLMFYTQVRYDAYLAENPDWKKRPYALVPDLVVEVVSPNDSYSAIDEKVDMYLADGVRVILIVDFLRQKVTIHTVDNPHPTILSGDAVLTGGDVLDGFEIRLSELFA